MPKPTRPPKPPKPAMRWGVYNKRGVLLAVETSSADAKSWTAPELGEHFERVMVTPIASKGAK